MLTTTDIATPQFAELAQEVVRLGIEFYLLAHDHAQWSQATFGLDGKIDGVLGAASHLEKEAREVQRECEIFRASERVGDPLTGEIGDRLAVELADCLLLVLDASRRFGLSPLALVRKAQAKMAVNKNRKWNTPVPGHPAEHVRE